MKEIWKIIDNTQEEYAISNLGNVRSYKHKKCKILKPCINSRGYYTVGINGKSYNVHSLVAKTFKPLPYIKGLVINHIDGNKLNNNVNNLEWVTPKYNINHAILNGRFKVWTNEQRKNAERKRLNTLRKKVLCVETDIIYISISHAAKATGLYVQNICKCCKGKLKQTGGYHWQYAN